MFRGLAARAGRGFRPQLVFSTLLQARRDDSGTSILSDQAVRPIKPRKIVPKPGRLRNKKEVLGEEEYHEQITTSAGKPLGGAAVG